MDIGAIVQGAGPAFQIQVPALPKRIQFSQGHVEALLRDPVMAAKLIMGEVMDEFQKARLRHYWFMPRCMDSSGFSSFKTRTFFLAFNLRCVLIPDHWSLVYYQNFNIGKTVFWEYYNTFQSRSPLFLSQIGRVAIDEEGEIKESKGKFKGPSCWTCFFKNGSKLMLPAPGFLTDAVTSASLRTNDLGIDEWTKVDGSGSAGIDNQLLGRGTRECFNKNHPLWCNHVLFLATAEDTLHPAYERFRKYELEVQKGNPEYATISYSFKDISDRKSFSGRTFKQALRQDRVLADMKRKFSKAKYLQEVLGRWSKNGKQWYSTESLDRAVDLGKQRHVVPICHRREDPEDSERIQYFLGADPSKGDARKSDDGALVGLRAKPMTAEFSDRPEDWQTDFVWAYKVRKANAGQWSGIIHLKNRHFLWAGILLDRGGGGIWIRPELVKTRQIINEVECEVVPIATRDENVVHANFCLTMFSPGDEDVKKKWDSLKGDDSLIDAAHCEFGEAIEGAQIGFPPPPHEFGRAVTDTWSQEKLWACKLLDLTRKQLGNIAVACDPAGTYLLTKNCAHQFSAKGRKDFGYAAVHAYARFLIWLKCNDLEYQVKEEDSAMCF